MTIGHGREGLTDPIVLVGGDLNEKDKTNRQQG
jgi:hypothetical protein